LKGSDAGEDWSEGGSFPDGSESESESMGLGSESDVDKYEVVGENEIPENPTGGIDAPLVTMEAVAFNLDSYAEGAGQPTVGAKETDKVEVVAGREVEPEEPPNRKLSKTPYLEPGTVTGNAPHQQRGHSPVDRISLPSNKWSRRPGHIASLGSSRFLAPSDSDSDRLLVKSVAVSDGNDCHTFETKATIGDPVGVVGCAKGDDKRRQKVVLP